MRGIFFDEEDARAAAARLRAAGYDATVLRERYAGEDDDEDHPWAVLTDAPEVTLELLVEELDGWLDPGEGEHAGGDGTGGTAAADLPTAPRRRHRDP